MLHRILANDIRQPLSLVMSNQSQPDAGAPTFPTAIADATNYIDWIIAKFTPYLGGKVLEVGIGHGSYFDRLRQFGPYLGVDIEPELVRQAKARFPEAEFAIADITAESFKQLVPLASVRSVVCCNVLEHIEDDRDAVANLLGALEPQGNLLLLVPALGFLYNDLDRLAGHHRRYDKGMMRKVLHGLPGKVKRMDYFNPIGGAAWLANRLVTHRSLDSGSVNRQIEIFDQYVLPLSRAVDPLTRGVFGQSLVTIVEKT